MVNNDFLESNGSELRLIKTPSFITKTIVLDLSLVNLVISRGASKGYSAGMNSVRHPDEYFASVRFRFNGEQNEASKHLVGL